MDSLQPADRVVVLTVGPETHVYPVDLLSSVAGVLDQVGGRDVFVTLSPLTQLARCLVAQMDDKSVDWQDAGLVYRGNEVLFDSATGSLWDTFRAPPLTGPLAGKTAQLLPAQVWPWRQWKEDHPTSNVMVLPGATLDKDAAQRVEAYLSSPVVPIPLPPPHGAARPLRAAQPHRAEPAGRSARGRPRQPPNPHCRPRPSCWAWPSAASRRLTTWARSSAPAGRK